ncbi:alpha/beta fold hydrolase [Colwellia sp. 12G3]|uniref:alpha/beta fold hydrolase n=1 Tax=Colwellia sp. 12G3 TaxID=2058299 RepID=UPI000C340B82|nr:alpha/beta fold hydrolase [Colwellia sp. 12G3]PKI14258.1 alpha/beta hydrolase [Colwellia sp. 12G3]
MTDNNEIDELSYQLGDLSLTALACGNKEHQPMLCLHGYLDNAASFLPLMQQTAQESDLLHNRRIIALDWPGHGHSDHRSVGAHYHFFDYVSDLFALFELNNWQAIDIVAHSMGAMIASAFAAAFPEKVKSLTLIDSFGFICASAEQTTEQLRKGVLSRVKSVKSSRAFTAETAVKARQHVSDLNTEHAKLIVQRSLIQVEATSSEKAAVDDTSVLYRWRSDPRLRTLSPYRLSLAQGQQLFSDIKCPLQLVYGDKGMEMVTTGLENFSAFVNNLITTKLEGGHHVHMEQTKELSSLLSHFLSKIQTSV